jgi:hypothetical protein
MVISLPEIPYIHRIYIWSWPTLDIYLNITLVPRFTAKPLNHSSRKQDTGIDFD